MAFFSGRPQIKEQLRLLRARQQRDSNCDFRLVLPPNVSPRGLPARKVRHLPVHHKFMILDVQMMDGAVRQIVFTGSHNFTRRPLDQRRSLGGLHRPAGDRGVHREL